MADANQEVFRLAAEKLEEAVVTAAGGAVDIFRKELEQFLEAYMMSFYNKLIGRIPHLAKEQNWKALSKRYAQHKLNNAVFEDTRGKSIESISGARVLTFLNFSGDLREMLAGRSGLDDFGKPRVTLKGQGEGLSPMAQIDSRGRVQWRAGSGRSGFARHSEAYTSLRFTLQVRMFPKIQGKAGKEIFNRFGGRDQTKLAVFEYGRSGSSKRPPPQPARPLLIPFLNWYGGPNLRQAVISRFKVDL